MKKILLLAVLLSQYIAFAQEDAWVYLTDKPNVATSIANPISILTQRSIDRKAAHNIPIDVRDVPVNEAYIAQLKTQQGVTVWAKSKWFNAVHVRLDNTADINALLSLAFVNDIIFADDNLNTTKVNAPQSKFEQEALLTNFNYGNAANQIQMFNGDDLHIANYTGTGMVVAVIDAGFPNVNTMSGFQRLRDNGGILGGYDFFDRTTDVYLNSSSAHGTLVLSDMAGYIENQFVGTAPDAQYYLFRTENAPNENPIEESLWVEAVERADSLGVNVINTSLGYKTYDNPNYSHTSADLDGNTTYITKGANIAFEKGMLLVNSAGNSGSNGLNAPADAAGVLTVGAVQSDGTYATFSSIGSAIQPTQKPDVVAQGQASYVIFSNDTIGTVNGTSFSSPTLAGGIVCLWEALPSLTNSEIMQLVRESSSQYTTPDYMLGYGIPDLSLALSQGLSVVEFQNENIELQVFPNPVTNQLNIRMPSYYEGAFLKLYDVLGKLIISKTINGQNYILPVAHVSKGMYILKIEVNGQSTAIKIIKN